MIRRRSPLKVDKELLALAGLYLAVIGLYALFEIAIVNYRPIIMPDGVHPEASFPSSHTMAVCVIMGSTIMLLGRYLKEKTLCRALQVICAGVIGVTTLHTDILFFLIVSALLADA